MGRPPDHVIAMIRRQPPAGAPVVAGSTPVVAFGPWRTATVATLGINPSGQEFLANKKLLSGANRRLATLDSLGAHQLDRLSDAQVEAVIADCVSYFQRRPYRRWFDPLDDLLRRGTGTSYYAGTACHLDLVQWATDPTWGQIADPTVRQALLDDGAPHLRAQLTRENVRLVLLNGRQVIEQAKRAGLATLDDAGELPLGTRTCKLYAGADHEVRWLGWSTNLQSSFGVSLMFRRELAHWLAKEANMSAPEIDPDGRLRRGLRIDSKAELVDLLRSWLAASTAPTIGDASDYGGKAWLHAQIDGYDVVLNADTRREAVADAVRRAIDDRPWHVVANRNGKLNKVLPGSMSELAGWYAYLRKPWSSAGQLGEPATASFVQFPIPAPSIVRAETTWAGTPAGTGASSRTSPVAMSTARVHTLMATSSAGSSGSRRRRSHAVGPGLDTCHGRCIACTGTTPPARGSGRTPTRGCGAAGCAIATASN